MKEIVVTKCGTEQERYYIIEGVDSAFMPGDESSIDVVVGRAELLGYKIKEVTRLSVAVDATIMVNVDVEGNEDTALMRASKIAQSFLQEIDKISILSDTENASMEIGEPIYWRNEDSGEETYK